MKTVGIPQTNNGDSTNIKTVNDCFACCQTTDRINIHEKPQNIHLPVVIAYLCPAAKQQLYFLVKYYLLWRSVPLVVVYVPIYM